MTKLAKFAVKTNTGSELSFISSFVEKNFDTAPKNIITNTQRRQLTELV